MPLGHRLDTPRRQNVRTDQTSPDPMSMNRLLPVAILALLLIPPASALSGEFEPAGLEISPGMKPLNLSLPPQPAGAAIFGSSPPAGLDQGADLTRLPDLGQGLSPAEQGRRSELPYGSGYEARQKATREPSGTGFGMSGGSAPRSGGNSGGGAGGGFGGHQGAGGRHGGGRR